MERVRNLPDRLNDDMIAKVEGWLEASPLPPLPVADRQYVLQFIRLLSDMPRRQEDEATGTVRKETFVEHLAGKPKAQLDWLRREAHLRFTFLPAIRELLELASEWRRTDDMARARSLARRRVEQELQERLTEARRSLKYERCEQDWIDGLPESMRSNLRGAGLLHRCADCGTYTQRPGWRQYQEFVAQMEGAA